MKLLIAYDGSKSSDDAIADLKAGGFPDENVEAITVSIAEVWMPPPPSANGNGMKADDYPVFVSEWAERRLAVAKSAVHEAETLSRHAREKIAHIFPKWKVSDFSTYGSPAWEILIKAEDFKPDIIVVGSQGRNAVGRILLGSISQKVLIEAKCSVRIARTYKRDPDLPDRVLVGYDGSTGSDLAADAVALREWPEGTEVKLVAAVQSLVPTTIGRFIPPVKEWVGDESETEKQLIEQIAQASLRKLRDKGLEASLEIKEGNPKEVLVDESDKWHASSMFVGAHAYHTELSRLLIGCTSTAVAERAKCTVEAVRAPVS